MSDESSYQGIRLAFLSYVQLKEAETGRGALLITDDATRPLEFRCTTPIQPNALQRMLYGQTLRSYIAADLVGEPLLGAVQEKPAIILVTEPLFFRLCSRTETFIVCVRRQGERISAMVDGNGDSGGAPSLLACSSGRFQPLTVTGPPSRADELGAALSMLRPIFSEIDLLEPFDRIEKVVAELDRQDLRGADKSKSK